MIKYYIILTFLILTKFVNGQLTSNQVSFKGCFETSGGTVYDSLNSLDGTVTGATQTSSGLVFDGTGDYVTCPDDANLQFYTSDASGLMRIDDITIAGDDFRHFLGGENGALGFAENGSTDAIVLRVIGAYTSPDGPAVSTGTEHWVGFIFDSDASTNNLILYVDGTTSTVTFNYDFSSGASTNLIGCRSVGNDPYIGTMSNISLWKAEKTVAQFDSIRLAGSGCVYPFDCWGEESTTGLRYVMNVGGTRYGFSVGGVRYSMQKNSLGSSDDEGIASYHMDGTCPESTHRWDDYDCAVNDFTHATNVALTDTNDYTEVIYIDPDASPGGDGSYGSPYDSWTDISNGINNYAYVQKRGTICQVTAQIDITSTNNFFGAYGTGDDPILQRTTAGNLLDMDYKFVMKDLNLRGYDIAVDAGILIFLHGASDESFIYNCEFDTAMSAIYTYGSDNRIINCEIHDLWLDGVWMAEADYIEIAHCNIYDINKAYESSHDQSISGGDGFQFELGWSQAWLHDNIIDKSTDGNKACMMLTNVGSSRYDEKCIIEFNELHGPLWDSDGNEGTSINLGDADNFIVARNHFKGYEGTLSSGVAITNFSYNDTIYGNTFEGYWSAIKGGGSNAVISNNTFYKNDTCINGVDAKIYNSIFSVADGDTAVVLSTIDDEDYNMFNLELQTGFTGNNSFVGNPHYTDSLNGDFSLQSNSDAIDAGTELDYYGYDITKKEITGTTDCGAYEYKLWWLILFIPLAFKKL